jgi:hypothetical protein
MSMSIGGHIEGNVHCTVYTSSAPAELLKLAEQMDFKAEKYVSIR